MSNTPTYQSWQNMLQRCGNEKCGRYKDYGGRGITVCERWYIFSNFYADMGEKPARRTLDRKDNNGNYEPSNCRWATKAQQYKNRRTTRKAKKPMRSSANRHGIDKPQRNAEQTAVIHSMLAGLDPFFRLRPTIPARCIQAFFLVAEKEDLSITEYARRAGLSQTTMSRNLIDMGERDRSHEEGPGLVEKYENIMNRREHLYRLTAKGRALLAAITRALNPEQKTPEQRIARIMRRDKP